MEVEIVVWHFDVFLLQRSGRQVLVYVLNDRNFEYCHPVVRQVELCANPPRYHGKPNREPQEIRLLFQP
jgi:hypothetical protein